MAVCKRERRENLSHLGTTAWRAFVDVAEEHVVTEACAEPSFRSCDPAIFVSTKPVLCVIVARCGRMLARGATSLQTRLGHARACVRACRCPWAGLQGIADLPCIRRVDTGLPLPGPHVKHAPIGRGGHDLYFSGRGQRAGQD